MVSLLDIADAPDVSVSIRGVDVPVTGLTATDIAKLLNRFKTLQEVMDGKPLTVDALIQNVPDAIGAIGAIGTGRAGDKAIEEKMLTLKLDDQIKVLKAIFDQTFGEHAGPLLAKLQTYADKRRVGGNGTERPTTSQLPSKASLRSATTPEMFGATHPGNSEASPS